MKDILLSICCISYNHEHCIKDALDGFIMQKTSFPFEIVISDDCSKDDTRKIIADYKAKYPELIHDVSPDKNMGSLPNFLHVQKEAIGKYVAICEGDDYWIDAYKLQKQVDYMEAHPECSCYAHNSLMLNPSNRQTSLFVKKILNTFDYPLETFITRDWFTPTQSIMYRRSAYQQFTDMPQFMHGDYSLLINLLLKEESYLHYDNEIMSVYRDGGWASTTFKELDIYNDSIAMLEFFKRKSNHRCDAIFDQQIQRQAACKEAYVSYNEKIKKSKSLLVRIGHWVCRNVASLVNKRVQCIFVTKTIKMENIPNIEKLD